MELDVRFLVPGSDGRTVLLPWDRALPATRIEGDEAVAAACQVVSYDGIRRALGPATQYTMIGGGAHFLTELEKILDRRDAAAL